MDGWKGLEFKEVWERWEQSTYWLTGTCELGRGPVKI